MIADIYRDRWNFANCFGAIDGKHIRVKRPDNAVSAFHNYKGYHSIVLLALVDADYKFICTNIGAVGREEDSTIFKSSDLFKKMQGNGLMVYNPTQVKNQLMMLKVFVIISGNTSKCKVLFPGSTAIYIIRNRDIRTPNRLK